MRLPRRSIFQAIHISVKTASGRSFATRQLHHATKISTTRAQQSRFVHSTPIMASATSFYDFKPLDSTSSVPPLQIPRCRNGWWRDITPPFLHHTTYFRTPNKKLTTYPPNRERQCSIARRLQGQSRLDCEHSFKMWIHPPI